MGHLACSANLLSDSQWIAVGLASSGASTSNHGIPWLSGFSCRVSKKDVPTHQCNQTPPDVVSESPRPRLIRLHHCWILIHVAFCKRPLPCVQKLDPSFPSRVRQGTSRENRHLGDSGDPFMKSKILLLLRYSSTSLGCLLVAGEM